MDKFLKQHLQRLRTATAERLDHTQLSRWVEENTYLAGKPYSFVGHEYQRKILDDPCPHKVVRKCSQVGLSETALRFAAALMGVMQNFTLLYIMPTASFAGTYGKTRFTPIVMSSPVLRSLASESGLDNQDVKQFGNNYLWFRGATSDTAPISVAADGLVCDEVSFADPQVLGDFQSRLTHSPYRWRFELSTPTFSGDAIDTAFQQSRRHWNAVRCTCCGHRFIPDYYEHVVIPDFNRHLDEITKDNIHLTRYQEAYLACPKCGHAVNLALPNREWVVENPDEAWLANGYQIQPFDAPSIISLPYLIEASTRYASKTKFRQFNLGLPADDAASGLTESDIEAVGVELAQSPFTHHVMGIDQGNTCYFRVAGVQLSGEIVEVHRERVPLGNFRVRYEALKAQYRVTATVMDMQPNVSLSMEMTERDPQCYPALYSQRQGLDVFEVKLREAQPEEGVTALRQVMLNRNALFDKLMLEIRAGRIRMRRDTEWDLMRTQMTDMKRQEATLRNGVFSSNWVKSAKGNDHYHHALAYLWVAAQLRSVAAQSRPAPGMFNVSSFRLRTQELV